jgi:hypothetical protein
VPLPVTKVKAWNNNKHPQALEYSSGCWAK